MSIATLLPVRRFVSMAVLAFTASAWAGEFYEDGAAIKGYDPVAYFKKPVKGAPDTRPSTRDVFFTSQGNRDAFAANPARYAPQYNVSVLPAVSPTPLIAIRPLL